jgi:NarL family two-component system response regulator LiaR
MCVDDTRQPITVIIVDDHPMAVDAVKGYLETGGDFEVVGSTGSGDEAVELVQEHVPDVVLMDLVLEGSEIDGIEATRLITEVSPSTQVLVLSNYYEDKHVFPALKAGAMGYVLKQATSREILDAVRAVAQRRPWLDRPVYEKLRQFLTQMREEVMLPEPGPELTPRENEVLALLADGMSNKEIAEELIISVKTVKTHVSNILQKLHLSDRNQARFWALQRDMDDRPGEGG